MDKNNENYSDPSQETLFFKDSSIEHLFQAEQAIRSMNYSDRLSESERNKRKKVYCHWFEFLRKNIPLLTMLSTVAIFYLFALAEFTSLTCSYRFYSVNPLSIMTNYGLVENVTVGICILITIVFPFLVYFILNFDCYSSVCSNKMSYAFASYNINFSCNTLIIMIMLLFSALAYTGTNFKAITTISSSIGLVSNIIAFSANLFKPKLLAKNLIVLGAAFISLLVSCITAGMVINVTFGLQLELRISALVMEVLLFLSVLIIWLLNTKIQNILESKFNIQNYCYLKPRSDTLSITVSSEVSKDASVNELKYDLGSKKRNLIVRVMFPFFAIVAASFFIVAMLPFQSSSITANLISDNNSFYIIVAECGNNACLEPLIFKDTEEDNAIKASIENSRDNISSDKVTIKRSMLNTKVQKWVSKTDLEMTEVTYILEEV